MVRAPHSHVVIIWPEICIWIGNLGLILQETGILCAQPLPKEGALNREKKISILCAVHCKNCDLRLNFFFCTTFLNMFKT